MVRGPAFSLLEIGILLDEIEDVLPISASQWQHVAGTHIARFPEYNRNVLSLRRKFNDLCNEKIPTGDPVCPPEVRRAKHLRRQIDQEMDAARMAHPTASHQGLYAPVTAIPVNYNNDDPLAERFVGEVTAETTASTEAMPYLEVVAPATLPEVSCTYA
jgi:hypothetical protein